MNIDRIKEIQQETAYPESVSVQQALLKVWNECEQKKVVNKNDLLPDVRQLLIDFCETYAEGQFEDPDDTEGIVDWYLKVKDN